MLPLYCAGLRVSELRKLHKTDLRDGALYCESFKGHRSRSIYSVPESDKPTIAKIMIDWGA